jgi:hypothetical protein
VRPFVKDPMNRDVAIRALGRIGSEADVPLLMEALKDSYGDTKVAAAEGIIRLSHKSVAALDSFLTSGDAALIKLALTKIEPQDREVLKTKVRSLLNDAGAAARELGAEFLVSHFRKEEVVDILDDYVAQPRYYYNVVVAIDRALYSVPRVPDGDNAEP